MSFNNGNIKIALNFHQNSDDFVEFYGWAAGSGAKWLSLTLSHKLWFIVLEFKKQDSSDQDSPKNFENLNHTGSEKNWWELCVIPGERMIHFYSSDIT